MLVIAPFAGPVSFPLLVAKALGKVDFELKNSCETNEIGDIILDSIPNLAKNRREGYKLVAGVYIRMYSLIGNKNSPEIYTIKEGTLADVNARVYAKLTSKKSVINTTPDIALRKAREEGKLALVGIEVEIGEIFEDEMKRMNYLVPECGIYSRVDPTLVLKAYEEGIRLMKEREEASEIISSASKYYSLDVMKKIINTYDHKLTTKKSDLLKSLDLYSLVKPEVKELEVN